MSGFQVTSFWCFRYFFLNSWAGLLHSLIPNTGLGCFKHFWMAMLRFFTLFWPFLRPWLSRFLDGHAPFYPNWKCFVFPAKPTIVGETSRNEEHLANVLNNILIKWSFVLNFLKYWLDLCYFRLDEIIFGSIKEISCPKCFNILWYKKNPWIKRNFQKNV
jgi:hypothetical protein